MKKAIAIFSAAVMAAFMAQGATLYWVGGNGGTWTEGGGGWATSQGGADTEIWNNANGDQANFNNLGAWTVNLGSDIATTKITHNWWGSPFDFNLQGYNLTFSGGSNKIQYNADDGTFTNGTIVMATSCQFQNGQTAVESGIVLRFDADISGSSNTLTKTGYGILVLAGTNNVYGSTVVNGGTILVESGSSLGTGNVTLGSFGSDFGDLHLQTSTAIDDGATLALQNTGNGVNLDFVGTDTVYSVTVNGVAVPSNTYTAAELNALPVGGIWSGTGSLHVVTGDPLPASSTYYIDAVGGNDLNNGLSPASAWATLARASTDWPQAYGDGDQILLARGQTHNGQLKLDARGSDIQPISVGAYGATNDPNPIIVGSGGSPSVLLVFPRNITVQDLEITGEGISAQAFWPTGTSTYQNVVFRDLDLHSISGTAINMISSSTNTSGVVFSDALIEGCSVSNVTGAGITVNKWDLENTFFHTDIVIRNNAVADCGGPGIQVGKLSGDSVIADNTVSDTGGVWLWGSRDVVVERNLFEGARGATDSCGVHIDIGNTGCIIQRNLSRDNEGGFVEILGNSSNNVYRYNISINDGARVQGVGGALQDGRMFWFGGYTGAGNPPAGPYNNYVYNNTIYTKADIVARFQAADTADGALIANNVIYIEGSTSDLTPGSTALDMLFDNNVVYNNKVPGAPFTVTGTIDADPGFANTGGLAAEDYIPSNTVAVLDKGIAVTNLPGDAIGLPKGFEVFEDYFGNPVLAQPDMGAIEISEAYLLVGWHTFVPAASGAFSNEVPDEIVSGIGATLGGNVAGGGGFAKQTEDGGLTYGSIFAGGYPVSGWVQPSCAVLATWSPNAARLDFTVTNNTGNAVSIASLHFDMAQWYGDDNATIRLSHLSEASDLADTPVANYNIAGPVDVNYGWFDGNTINTGLGAMTDRTLAPGEVAAFRIEIATPDGGSAIRVDNIGVGGYISSVAELYRL
jgi:hypothetical protein